MPKTFDYMPLLLEKTPYLSDWRRKSFIAAVIIFYGGVSLPLLAIMFTGTMLLLFPVAVFAYLAHQLFTGSLKALFLNLIFLLTLLPLLFYGAHKLSTESVKIAFGYDKELAIYLIALAVVGIYVLITGIQLLFKLKK